MIYFTSLRITYSSTRLPLPVLVLLSGHVGGGRAAPGGADLPEVDVVPVRAARVAFKNGGEQFSSLVVMSAIVYSLSRKGNWICAFLN